LDDGRRNGIGSAKLFRLEEYKLPEFKVTVQTPEENGKKKSFRLGEKVEVNIQADYYFGGPVSNAAVEVVRLSKPFLSLLVSASRLCLVLRRSTAPGRQYYGSQGQLSNANDSKPMRPAKPHSSFDTPRENYNQDFSIASRRALRLITPEIIASTNVRVTRPRYYGLSTGRSGTSTDHKDKVTVDIKALDAKRATGNHRGHC